MKKMKIIAFLAFALITACQNEPWDFPDYDYTTVYFPYQSPVRTLILGEDIIDNSLDNAHKFKVMAALGGVYENTKEIVIDVRVDNQLCDSLKFSSAAGNDVFALPSDYYILPEKQQIVIPSGSVMGGMEVQLTDAFFNDPRSISHAFVLPLVMTSVSNADSILSGASTLENPDRRVTGDWTTVPKDYTLYAVKFINPWHGNYLRRGVDVVKGKQGNTTLDTTIVYRAKYVEWDEVISISTVSLNEASMQLNTRNKGSLDNISFEVMIQFDPNGENCTLSHPESASYTLTGSGKFVNDGDEWGNIKRDVLHLNYEIDFGSVRHTFTDTIVMRDRGIAFETFTPVVF
ncbi:MAG TPA: DUF5627 domain-containing protein [Prolixibacteraceae bacterium]|nr:DUF5627 domain-containing protein [Prolixibacteraceae bacterium]